MKPIKIEPRKDFIQINSKEIEIEYDDGEYFHFMPEFLESVYDGSNANELKDANKILEHYATIRDKLTYLGSSAYNDKRIILEFYIDENSNLVVFLMEKYKDYSLKQISIHKPFVREVQ